MVKSIYPGTFDPVTNGHFDIIQRASYLFEELSVCVYSGSIKRSIFSAEERVEMIENTVSNLKNVNVIQFDNLTVDIAKKLKAGVIIRGLRIGADFEYEREMALTIKLLSFSYSVSFIRNALRADVRAHFRP